MSPASGNAPLRGIGPEDVDAAGELAPKVQEQNQAHELIKHVAASHPTELTTIQQLEEDKGRSKALDEGEVESAATKLVGNEKKKGGLVKVLSARVRGYDRPVEEMYVVVLYETPSGRNARCAVPYEPMSKSQKTYDKGVAEGKIAEGKPTDSDQSHLEAQLRRAESTIKRLEADGGDSEDAGDTPPEPPEETPETEVEVPEGVVPGETPGWPVDGETGEPLDLPDQVREELAAAAAAGEGIGDDETPAPAPAPDLDAVELPQGNADALIAGMDFYSDDVVAALAKRDERKTVREAAETVLEKRQPDKG